MRVPTLRQPVLWDTKPKRKPPSRARPRVAVTITEANMALAKQMKRDKDAASISDAIDSMLSFYRENRRALVAAFPDDSHRRNFFAACLRAGRDPGAVLGQLATAWADAAGAGGSAGPGIPASGPGRG